MKITVSLEPLSILVKYFMAVTALADTLRFTYCFMAMPQNTMLQWKEYQRNGNKQNKQCTHAMMADSPNISAVKYAQYGIRKTNTGFSTFTCFVYLDTREHKSTVPTHKCIN